MSAGEKTFCVLTRGNLYGPITLDAANTATDSEDPDGFGDEEAIILRLVPSDYTGSNIEDETRDSGYWPPK